MKKMTISKLKSIFGSKKGKRQHHQQSSKSSRSHSPESQGPLSPSSGESFRPLQRTPPPSRVGPPPSPPVPTNPVAPVTPEPSAPLPLSPCPVCARTFVPGSLAKHVKICEKMTVKKRKTFDSSRQRREGTDLEQYLPKNFGLPENSPFLEKSPPNTAKATPKPKAHSVRSAVMKPAADLQKCPHCNRAFGQRAFERHVEWCGDKAKILPLAPAQPPPHLAGAKQRLHARTQYKAPPVRNTRSSQSREKSSNSRSASVESSRGISPPREYGDYRHQRTRASESISSNDCHEDSSPHIPVIRNSRVSQNNSSGDANVKARQARLARDLSSSRNSQEPHPSSVQQSNTDPNIVKQESQTKPRNRLNTKKKQHLKKLEEIANKYNERIQKPQEETLKKSKLQTTSSKNKKKLEDKKKLEKKETPPKSQIPIPKKNTQKEKITANDNQNSQFHTLTDNVTEDNENNSNENFKNSEAFTAPSKINVKEKDKKTNTNKEVKRKIKESTISLNSVDEASSDIVNRDKNCHSIGINTELLCPCVPCVIHDTPEVRTFNPKQTKSSKKLVDKNHQTKIETPMPVVELLYKNPNMITSSCDIENKRVLEEEIYSNENISVTNCIESVTNLSNSLSELKEPISKDNSESLNAEVPSISSDHINCEPTLDTLLSEVPNLSEEILEQNYEQDLSEYSFEDSFENKNELSKETNENDEEDCRYGSGETYTKFTENPEDLEEFLKITDKLISKTELEKCIENIHTPQTNSIESINKDVEENENKSLETNHIFSNSLEELKNDLKDLLQVAGKDVNIANSLGSDTETKKLVNSMEHITVYGLKFVDQETKDPPPVSNDSPSELKLPCINECNQFSLKTPSNKKNISSIYRQNKKCKMLGQQKRSDSDYKTFIINENQDDISDEAPPLKLPRIEKKRLDDNYDPFASAARQMKELMSSDTDISKKIQNPPKNSSNGTLPSLRPCKDKNPPYNKSENSKMIKDTINKTYQKAPTLQRMKSFGSASNENNNSSLGGRCSSFRINRNDKRNTKLNSTFTKLSKENVSSTEKTSFSRNSSLNRSFSSYSNSSYSTPKLKDKIPKISQSMHHGFQRTTIKQPVKLDKINKDEEKKNFVNLDTILGFDNTSMTDSNYIDPRLINENDNLPINVNTILNNPDIISSMESLLTTENLPAKFESFNSTKNNNYQNNITQSLSHKIEKNNNINKQALSDFSSQYDKILNSLEQSIASKTSVRDDDSLCEDFDLEEFMTNFDDEVHKQKMDKRTYSSTTRVVASDYSKEFKASDTKVVNSPKVVNSGNNGLIPVNKSTSLIFSSNNIVSDKVFPSSVKRSTSLLDSLQKKSGPKMDSVKGRHKTDQLEDDLMQSLKDFDKFYESEKNDNQSANKEIVHSNKNTHDTKKETRRKDHKTNKSASTNGNYTPNGKSSNDSAYSSLNRISPSKLSLCNAKDTNGITSLEKIPDGSDSSCSHKDDIRSLSSEEFLAMERSTELNDASLRPEQKDATPKHNEARACSRASWRRDEATLSSSGSECSLHKPPPRLSRFCHECGSRFLDTAKFCIECGVKRLLL